MIRKNQKIVKRTFYTFFGRLGKNKILSQTCIFFFEIQRQNDKETKLTVGYISKNKKCWGGQQ